MIRWIIVAILLLPVAEITAFIVVANVIGTAWALLLMLATSFFGFWVLREAGRGALAQFRSAVGRSGSAALQANAGALLTVLGGLLLLVPGFITDVIGALLLLRPMRQWFGRLLTGSPSPLESGARRTRARAPDGVVDLEPEEWRQVPERELEGTRKRPDQP